MTGRMKIERSSGNVFRDIGFRPAATDAGWIWKGRRPQRAGREPPASHAFAALAGLRGRG